MSAKQVTPLTSGRRIYGQFSHYTGRFGVMEIEGSKSRAQGSKTGSAILGGLSRPALSSLAPIPPFPRTNPTPALSG